MSHSCAQYVRVLVFILNETNKNPCKIQPIILCSPELIHAHCSFHGKRHLLLPVCENLQNAEQSSTSIFVCTISLHFHRTPESSVNAVRCYLMKIVFLPELQAITSTYRLISNKQTRTKDHVFCKRRREFVCWTVSWFYHHRLFSYCLFLPSHWGQNKKKEINYGLKEHFSPLCQTLDSF